MNDKRQILVDTALSLFYKNGINSIGINEIIKVSGIAKKTLYNYFDSKEALVLAALKQRNAIFVSWLTQQLSGAVTNQQLVEKLFSALSNWFANKAPELGDFRGCFFINSSAEFSNSSSEVSLYCQYHKQQIRQLINQHMPVTDEHLLDAICILKEGAITTAYVANDFSMAKKCIQILQKLEKEIE